MIRSLFVSDGKYYSFVISDIGKRMFLGFRGLVEYVRGFGFTWIVMYRKYVRYDWGLGWFGDFVSLYEFLVGEKC